MASLIRRRRRAERGAALVELALCLPLLLVVIAGIVDFAFLFQRYEVITNAAREGARLGSLPGFTEAMIRQHVRNYVKAGLALSDAQMNTVMPTSAGSDPSVVVSFEPLTMTVSGTTVTMPGVKVTVTYEHSFLLLGPLLALLNGSWGDTMDLVAFSQMRLEIPAGG